MNWTNFNFTRRGRWNPETLKVEYEDRPWANVLGAVLIVILIFAYVLFL